MSEPVSIGQALKDLVDDSGLGNLAVGLGKMLAGQQAKSEPKSEGRHRETFSGPSARVSSLQMLRSEALSASAERKHCRSVLEDIEQRAYTINHTPDSLAGHARSIALAQRALAKALSKEEQALEAWTAELEAIGG